MALGLCYPGTRDEIPRNPKIGRRACMSEGENVTRHSRRNFLIASATTAAIPLVARSHRGEAAPLQPVPNPRDPIKIALKINDRERHVSLDVRTTLLDA